MFKVQRNKRDIHRYLWYKQSLQGKNLKTYSKKNDKSTEVNTKPVKILSKKYFSSKLNIYKNKKRYECYEYKKYGYFVKIFIYIRYTPITEFIY